MNNSLSSWVVYLGNTAKNSFSSTSDWVTLSGLQQVFSGTVTNAGDNAWYEITFSTPFIWDGTSNLVVAIDENQSSYATSNSNWQVSNLGTNRSIYYRNDSTNPDPASPPSANGSYNYVNNMQLVATLPSDCAGAPVLASITPNSNLLCVNDDLELSIDNATTNYFYNGITYQWQQFDGTNWNDISGATESSFSVEGVSVSADYRVVIGCSFTGDNTELTPVSITVNALPTVVVDKSTSVICSSSSVAITASGADSYVWSPATGLSSTNTAVVNASPTSPTVYTVTGTDANGCVNTAQSTVTPYNNVATNVATTPTELCETNVPTSITVIAPADVDGGNWEYRFLNGDGTTEVQTWNATNTYNFIPTEDSVYTYFYQLRNSACATPLDSVMVSIVVGFGAEDVAITNYDCNNLAGSVTLINPFGQTAETVMYVNDFNAPADLTAFELFGNAANTDDRLVLTPSATSNNGSAMLTMPGFTVGTNNSYSISFDLTADMPINNYGTGGADGITYSFGNDATPTSNGSNHNGRGTKLRLSFDSAQNSGENNNQSGIYLVYGWTANNAFGPASTQTLAYSNNTALWKGKTDVPVVLTMKQNGTADLTVDGVTVFSNVQLPQAYLDADVTNWKHLFSAGTGGDALRHAIDNLNISAGVMQYGITQNATATPQDWQLSPSFTDLMPGTYYIWAAKDVTAVCGKQIKTIEIVNTNPVVNLGADTTICQGESLVLDAGNPGATYVWSGTNEVSQTLTVTTAGTYTVYATAANGCFGVGNINIAVNDAPTATGIYRQGAYPTFTYTVLNANNADAYDWNFGDGTTLTNAPSTVTHYYTSDATVTVTATLTNECGSTQVSQTYADLSVEENQLTGLAIFPNPATDQFTVSVDNSSNATVSVVSTTGTKMMDSTEFSNTIVVNTTNWESGIYFVVITNNGQTATNKIVVR
ncbi:MAG: T9SS type A sorting domain-containing protein [Crocinitomicaceae bacterium]